MTSRITHGGAFLVDLFLSYFRAFSGKLSFQFYFDYLHVGCGDLSALSQCCSS